MKQSEASFMHHSLPKLFLTLALCLCVCSLPAQEICDNGLDDDNDGWVDLQDPDCACRWEPTKNILLNPSVEEHKHCLTNGAPYSENYDIVEHWLYGVQPNGDIAFYRNLSCPADSAWAILNYVPRPIPDGNGFLEMIRGTTRPGMSDVPESTAKKYYVAQCLQTPLIKDRDYTFSFYGAAYLNKQVTKFAIDSFTVAVFGNSDCNAVPFGTANKGNGCPTNYPGWVMLGKTTFVSPYQWVQAKMMLTIPQDINVIEIGQDCSLVYLGDTSVGGNVASKPYYYLDNFQLAETKDFNFQYITILSGDVCNGGYILKAPTAANANYQWYKDSIALVGQTDSLLVILDTSKTAYYNVRVTKGGRCQISEPILVKRSLLSDLHFPTDTFSCQGDTLRLGKSQPGVAYSWSGKQDSVVTLYETDDYTITASDAFGCTRDFIVNADFKDCIGCKVFIPSAFTPNGDGLNEELRGYSNCPLDNYQLQIYNRWGQKIFEANTISKGWDGTFNGKKMPADVYVYLVRYKNSRKEDYKIGKGTVAIIR
jgi:gliding motility-associated-like protein